MSDSILENFLTMNTTIVDQNAIQFPRSTITLPPFVPTLMSYRWNDEDDCEPLAKKSSGNNLNPHRPYQHVRRRIPKRYSNIVGSFETKRKDSIVHSVPQLKYSPTNISSRPVSKSKNEITNCFNLHRRKSHGAKDYHDNHTTKHDDILAHRMQAAMSSELMHSLDRNFVFSNFKQSIPNSPMVRSYSLNICTCWNEKSDENSCDPDRGGQDKIDSTKEIISIELPTPDYDEINEDIIIKTIKNDINTSEEPIADYDDSKPTIKFESDFKSSEQSTLDILSSYTRPPELTIKSQEDTFTPPLPPPLPNLYIQHKENTLYCRTIADSLSADHKLILKDEHDEEEYLKESESPKSSSQIQLKYHYINAPKNLSYRKIGQSLSCSNLSDASMTQITNNEANLTMLFTNPSVTDEKILDRISLSSPGTSIEINHENRSSSSKIYNDYKQQASTTSLITSTIPSHSIIIKPVHTHFGLRSSTSSGPTNEKLLDMTLSSKQMNVCVINQLNEHLSTRFRRQQKELCSNNNNRNNNNTIVNNHSSDDLTQEYMSGNNSIQSNIYDEPKDLPEITSVCPTPPPPPPPPPPLPAGGFPPIIPSINRSFSCQRASTMTLPRESINSNIPSSTVTPTIPSNLSDTRILRELRENPLFTRAKEQLEIEPGSNGRRSGRRLIGSTTKLANTETIANDTVAYVRLDNYSNINMKKVTNESSTSQQQSETIIINSDELNSILGKRAKSMNEMNIVKSRPCSKSSLQAQYRQSELELIFQKRAQRIEQKLK
ncbi:unnamed protein product [Rotaria socialis]